MDPYIGEIRLFAGTFAPLDWAWCDGQALSIQQFQALYAVIGTSYGGNGRTTFNLPDLRGCVPLDQGQGPGLTPHVPGDKGGDPSVTLGPFEFPQHKHTAQCTINEANSDNPASGIWAKTTKNSQGQRPFLYAEFGGAGQTVMNPLALGTAGGSQPHNNMQPYLGINFIIALNGVWPPKP